MIGPSLDSQQAADIAAACVTFDPYRRLGYQADTLFAYLTRPDATLARESLWHEGKLAGVLCRRQPWLRGPMIEMLAILPALQNQGIGAAAVRLAQKEAGRNLWATVSAFHAPARRFYARLGFQEIGAIDGLIAEGEAEILLRWRP